MNNPYLIILIRFKKIFMQRKLFEVNNYTIINKYGEAFLNSYTAQGTWKIWWKQYDERRNTEKVKYSNQ